MVELVGGGSLINWATLSSYGKFRVEVIPKNHRL